jgi:very-short-patch-repair endonuclease
LQYNTEHPFKRHDVIKTYFVDFYFPSLDLIIELDGTQHKNTVEYDTDRDNYIMTNYNVNIIRVSHKEYQAMTKLELIKSLLG